MEKIEKILNVQNKQEKIDHETASWIFVVTFFVFLFSIPFGCSGVYFFMVIVLPIQLMNMLVNKPYRTNYVKACKDCLWYKRTIEFHVCNCPELYFLAVDNEDTKCILGSEWKPEYVKRMGTWSDGRCEKARGKFHEGESCGKHGDWWTSKINHKGEENV